MTGSRCHFAVKLYSVCAVCMWGVQTLRVVAQLSTTGLQIPVMFFLAQGFVCTSASAGVSLVMSIAGGIGLAVFFFFCVLGKHRHHRCRQRALAPTRNGAKLNVASVVFKRLTTAKQP